MSGAEVIGAAVGLALGGIVMLLWTGLGKWLVEERFWPAFGRLARDLTAGAPPAKILSQYAALIRLLALYVGKMTCRVGIAVLPVVLCCMLLGPIVFQAALRSARCVTVYPVQSVHITLANRPLKCERAGELSADLADAALAAVGIRSLSFEVEGQIGLMEEVDRGAELRIVTPSAEVIVPAWTAPIAVSNSAWTCLGLQLLGMEAHHTSDGPSLLIVRPTLGDENALYPYLSDVELAFWSGLAGASLLAGLMLKLPGKRITHS